jgi:SNF2 family DNA or RNA helicase
VEIEKLAGTRFHSVVLDEAQAIKNAAAKTAKAARLLRADRRIALSGTPVENHLGELWSLFDFLNPGLLGASARSVKALDQLGEAGVGAMARALRPFILRRTKQQVLAELPPKTEQTLVCELEGDERRRYDELRRHFQARVLREVDAKGLARSKIHVLEALLRLRQAACHPGLLDRKLAGEHSAKLDLLREQLDETLDEGHKALVFSQFTSLLAIVRTRLDAAGVVYEYLDGRTRDRERRVARFQEDPACKLFLISLKAGGLGLNLTAADYVFLLDPWWNPAVEAQAIDRAHRIGQAKAVFAYRLVAKDTIEEKILALQERKKKLADAVISADASVLRSLTRQDLELLLG